MIALLHTCLGTSDLERSLGFYRCLGLELRREIRGEDDVRSYFLGVANRDLPELQLMEMRGADEAAGESLRPHHVAFGVDDLEKILEKLADNFGVVADVAPYESPDPARRIAWIRDPDSHSLELIQRLQ